MLEVVIPVDLQADGVADRPVEIGDAGGVEKLPPAELPMQGDGARSAPAAGEGRISPSGWAGPCLLQPPHPFCRVPLAHPLPPTPKMPPHPLVDLVQLPPEALTVLSMSPSSWVSAAVSLLG